MKKIFLTPGPLNISKRVKNKMLFDYGSRDTNFNDSVYKLRKKIVNLTTNNSEKYTSILIPGSGTYAIESVLCSTISNNNKLGLFINGAYGKRMNSITDIHNITTIPCVIPENESFQISHVDKLLNKYPDITNIGIVHCETTTGILNNISEIGEYLKDKNKTFFVDCMSSFGGIPIDIEKCNIDYLVSSSNKCLHGPPGLSFCIANKNHLEKCKGISKTVSLDLYSQWKHFEENNQFRFTPPTHIVMSLYEAILELEELGGIKKRNKQYKKYNKIFSKELGKIGFEKYLKENQSEIITTWKYPKENFNFNDFYNYLRDNDILIYPGKLSNEDVFRIGNIGDLSENDINYVINNIKKY
tara:strand:- start:3854 stop:4924 length:1071 start_codon:yes stop_codon:yes gene_type:complete